MWANNQKPPIWDLKPYHLQICLLRQAPGRPVTVTKHHQTAQSPKPVELGRMTLQGRVVSLRTGFRTKIVSDIWAALNPIGFNTAIVRGCGDLCLRKIIASWSLFKLPNCHVGTPCFPGPNSSLRIDESRPKKGSHWGAHLAHFLGAPPTPTQADGSTRDRAAYSWHDEYF